MQFRILAATLLFAGAATAQETADDSTADFTTGTPVEQGDGIGQPYFDEVFGDWQRRCIRTEGGNDPCQLYQLLEDGNGGSVAEVTVFPLPDGGPAVAGATIITPLETLLTEQVVISVDGGEARRYPFSFCTATGCIARLGLTEDDLSSYRRGNVARLRIVPALAPDQEVTVPISLSGFTAGFASLGE